jgi:hypothetical protein
MRGVPVYCDSGADTGDILCDCETRHILVGNACSVYQNRAAAAAPKHAPRVTE